jgi:hypothetical protein
MVCDTKIDYLKHLRELCIRANITLPLTFIASAFILDLIEYFTRNILLKERKEYIKLKYFGFDSYDLHVLISTTKSILLIAAFIFVLMGTSAWK